MRWFLLLLVIVNAAFFAWQRVEGGVSSASAVHLPPTRNNVVLLTEREGSASVVSVVASEQLDDQSGAREECWWRGPYSGRKAIPDFAQIDLVKAWREEFETSADFWVYLGPFDTLTESTNVSASLRDRGLDSFVIARGDLENAVSLGVFSEEARAERHAASFERRGYDPRVRRVARTTDQYWLVLQGDASTPQFQEALLAFRELPGGASLAEKKSCNLVASLKDFD